MVPSANPTCRKLQWAPINSSSRAALAQGARQCGGRCNLRRYCQWLSGYQASTSPSLSFVAALAPKEPPAPRRPFKLQASLSWPRSESASDRDSDMLHMLSVATGVLACAMAPCQHGRPRAPATGPGTLAARCFQWQPPPAGQHCQLEGPAVQPAVQPHVTPTKTGAMDRLLRTHCGRWRRSGGMLGTGRCDVCWRRRQCASRRA
jgi:hypothetical protein